MSCDEIQIAFEQLEAGAPAALGRTEIDDHVTGCASCAAYVRVTRKVSESMANVLTMSPGLIDVGGMRERIRAERRRARRGLVFGPLAFGALLAALSLSGGQSAVGAIVQVAVATALFAAFIWWMQRRHQGELAAVEARGGEELLAGLRGVLTREIDQLRSSFWVLPGLAVLFNHEALLAGALPDLRGLLVAAGLLAMTGYAALRRRRLIRERALLER